MRDPVPFRSSAMAKRPVCKPLLPDEGSVNVPARPSFPGRAALRLTTRPSHVPPISDLATLLSSLRPELNDGVFVFATLEAGQHVEPSDLVALVREPEGLSVVVEERSAIRLGLNGVFRCAWITLTVNSDVQAIGLTAAFSAALGHAGISCNVVAGAHHDHIFVPIERATDALSVLQDLQRRGSIANSGHA